MLARSLLLGLLLSGCTTAGLDTRPDGYFLLVGHSSGGPAPIASELAVYPDSTAVYRSTRGERTRFPVPRYLFLEMKDLLANPELQRGLDSVNADSKPFFDHEEWWFVVEGKESRFACREVQPAPSVIELIEAAQRIARLNTRERWFTGAVFPRSAERARGNPPR